MNDLIQTIESYNWTDELGHPLVNCVEWDAIKEWIREQEEHNEEMRQRGMENNLLR